MAGCLQGLKRANSAKYGDLEGPMTMLKSGKLSITIEDGKVIAWIVNADDIILSKENVESVELSVPNVTITDLGSGGGKTYIVNIYRIVMKNGEEGILRLVTSNATKVLMLIS